MLLSSNLFSKISCAIIVLVVSNVQAQLPVGAVSSPAPAPCDIALSQQSNFQSFQAELDQFRDTNGDGIYAICLRQSASIIRDSSDGLVGLRPQSNTHIYGIGRQKTFIGDDINHPSGTIGIDLSNTTGVYLRSLALRVDSHSGNAIRAEQNEFTLSKLSIELADFSNKAILITAGGSLRYGNGLQIESDKSGAIGIFLSGDGSIQHLDSLQFTSSGSYARAIESIFNDSIGAIRNARINLSGNNSIGFNFDFLTDVKSIENVSLQASGDNSKGIAIEGSSSVGLVKNFNTRINGNFSSAIYVNNSAFLKKLLNSTIITTGIYSDGIVFRQFPATGIANELTKEVVIVTSGQNSSGIKVSLQAQVNRIEDFRIMSQPGAGLGGAILLENDAIVTDLVAGSLLVPNDGTDCIYQTSQTSILNQTAVSCNYF